MNRKELEKRLVDFVNGILSEADPQLRVGPDTALFEEGVIDSLRILDLIACVEELTGRKVPDAQVRLANFRSVRVIAAAFGDGRADRLGRTAETSAAGPALHVFERRSGRGKFTRVLDELEARGQGVLAEPGRMAFTGRPLQLLGRFDAIMLGWAEELGAETEDWPVRLPVKTLARAGCAVDPETAREIVPPAVCYHAYPRRQGRRLASAPLLLTGRGPCHRSESSLDPSQGRLRDFEMREIVMIGSRTDVERFRQRMIARVKDLVTDLDLEGRIETANDPFFLGGGPVAPATDSQPRGRWLMQRVLPLKYELRLALDRDRTCAVASFNHHLAHFGRRFDIRLPSGVIAHTGCVAFGLERWVLAFLAQHGIDEHAWPAAVGRETRHARIA
ncbi:MAG TPA: phosphopantetheine-binding protein [Gemmatimonadota bacterium]|nr:phosphopantetheine-binding protein [Gemmatimonadota bacterium]